MTDFTRDDLLSAFDEIGRAAIEAGTRLEICIYGGSALIVASNFRFGTEDVDIQALETPWPEWLQASLASIAETNAWDADWFNDHITMFLSKQASREKDHVLFTTFPRRSDKAGLAVHVPQPQYLLALKMRALRINNQKKADKDMGDVSNLLRMLEIKTADEAIAIMLRYFPQAGSDTGRASFLVKWLLKNPKAVDAPTYPLRSLSPDD
jgi:hypothetical protein